MYEKQAIKQLKQSCKAAPDLGRCNKQRPKTSNRLKQATQRNELLLWRTGNQMHAANGTY
jgi:hypothetical protein